jgi:transmembrane sensor
MTHDAPRPDSPDLPLDWEALARFLAGESPVPERERIERYLSAHANDAEMLAALDDAMRILSLREAEEIDVESALRTVTARRDAAEATVIPIAAQQSGTARRRGTIGFGWRIASGLAAAAVLVFAARAVHQRGVGTRARSVVGVGRTYATAIGQRDSVRLPDGGHVILGPASRLTIAPGFGAGVREVQLHGEAYFDVVHDTTRPFVVRLASASVRDVGTSFAVHEDSARVRVVVTSGSVLLRSTMDSARQEVLAAGDVGMLEPDGRLVTTHGVPTTPYLSWMQGSLVFRDAPLTEVSTDLRRWYGVVLQVNDSTLARRHLTMTFNGDPIDRVLRVIGLGLGATVELHGDTAVLRAARPQ